MLFRTYDASRHNESIQRMWQEVGWIEKGKGDWLWAFLECGRTFVAELDGQAECLTQTVGGVARYLEEDLPFSLISAVTTSHIARKRGAPKQLVARALAYEAERGTLVAGLGMFDQGFYNQLGFGTGGYEHWLRFDPASLRAPADFRVPRRITKDDWEAVYASRAARWRLHGGCTITDPCMTKVTMLHRENAFGFGYYDGPNGELTHHLWLATDSMMHGPYQIQWLVFRNRAQFLELMALLKSLADQVKLVAMPEPPGIQMQDLLNRPFRQHTVTEGSRFETRVEGNAWWQARILDLPGCLARTHLSCRGLRFNLRLTDPLAELQSEDLRWTGVGGEYVVEVGEESCAKPGCDSALPTLEASVGAFTRLWLGIRPARGLAFTDCLSGPDDLLTALDRVFCLPEPRPDWDF